MSLVYHSAFSKHIPLIGVTFKFLIIYKDIFVHAKMETR